ncbi:hypothetical protein F4780DRAFT_781311 [Xylariomycetidae sp. FL0641]|nr:hypothetical protein F4780DRAFT_781311 [Xylariomycetidae sp. FL0641]
MSPTPSTLPPFSVTTQVYPSFLPALARAGRAEKRLASATVAAVGIGYGISKMRSYTAAEQQHQQQARLQLEADNARRANAMMDAYGDRSTLAELEQAVKAYGLQGSQ